MKIYVYISIVIAAMISLGFFLVYEQSIVACNQRNIDFCVVREMLMTFPSGIGSFCGIFISALLAYQLSMMKSKRDDLANESNKNAKEACKLLLQTRQCLSNLSAIKHEYYELLGNDTSILRGMKFPYVVNNNFSLIEPNTADFIFLLKKSKLGDNINVDIISKIQNAFFKYNDAVGLFKDRNALAKDVHRIVIECQREGCTYIPFGVAKLNIRDFSKKYGINELLNYISITESLICLVDEAISEIVKVSFDVPMLANEYFSENGCEIIIPIIQYQNDDSVIFNEIEIIDVKSELDKLESNLNNPPNTVYFRF